MSVENPFNEQRDIDMKAFEAGYFDRAHELASPLGSKLLREKQIYNPAYISGSESYDQKMREAVNIRNYAPVVEEQKVINGEIPEHHDVGSPFLRDRLIEDRTEFNQGFEHGFKMHGENEIEATIESGIYWRSGSQEAYHVGFNAGQSLCEEAPFLYDSDDHGLPSNVKTLRDEEFEQFKQEHLHPLYEEGYSLAQKEMALDPEKDGEATKFIEYKMARRNFETHPGQASIKTIGYVDGVYEFRTQQKEQRERLERKLAEFDRSTSYSNDQGIDR